ncbi:cytochrome b/b6 domain-containing protein [Sphingosinicella sp. YJ22]|uniref:cytochrome b/b6 domain-containing protein n=1 Tax=Sphingosinicella sp. YJ22 TaxID=1104780 RepID=UPI00140B37B6|nr:cytochrome b/b6 domain-containing protein [Sphingosinicella sp. YJ22]
MIEPDAAPGALQRPRVRIWDWPTRAFHWLLVLLIPALWWTAENDQAEIHVLLGLGAFALILFRLLWGLMGSSTARFASFIRGPRAVMSYLNGHAAKVVGHNPLGGLSVAAMLALLTVQAGLGLFATDDDGEVFGPLSLWLDEDMVETITELHETLFNVLLVFIALHIAAILYYALVQRKNLVGPMLTGRGGAPEGVEEMRGAPAWRLAVAALVTLGATAWLWTQL